MSSSSWFSRLVGRPWFWVVAIAAIVAFPLGRALFTRLPPMLPVVGQFPRFSLIDQRGESFGSSEVEGRVWLEAVFSPSTPAGREVGEKIKKIQHRAHNLGVAFHVVCITSDPKGDSPADLDAFVRSVHGSPRMWSFLTGDSVEVEALLQQVTPISGGPTTGAALLVDPSMRVRARYDLSSEDVVERILRDVGMVANRGG
jgi:cytochrome oxidase Cu insertion factor (SCO1/SenC/PrrC family)